MGLNETERTVLEALFIYSVAGTFAENQLKEEEKLYLRSTQYNRRETIIDENSVQR